MTIRIAWYQCRKPRYCQQCRSPNAILITQYSLIQKWGIHVIHSFVFEGSCVLLQHPKIVQ